MNAATAAKIDFLARESNRGNRRAAAALASVLRIEASKAASYAGLDSDPLAALLGVSA